PGKPADAITPDEERLASALRMQFYNRMKHGRKITTRRGNLLGGLPADILRPGCVVDRLEAVKNALECRRQGFVRHVLVREDRVAADFGNLLRIRERKRRWIFVERTIGMPSLAFFVTVPRSSGDRLIR